MTKRLRDVLESEVDEKYYLSEEKTAKLIAQLNERNDSTSPVIFGSLEHYGNDQMNRVYAVDGVAPTLTVVSGGGREQKIAVECVGNVNPSGNGMNGAVYADRGLSPTLTTNKGEGTKILTREVRPVLTPDREEKRQNGRRFKENDEEAFTLTAQDKHGVAIGRYPRYRIRKLTPRECWRLQGFTDEQFDKARAAGVSDSQLYKQAGNAVTVNVISATSRRLIRMLLAESDCGNGQASENQRVEAVV